MTYKSSNIVGLKYTRPDTRNLTWEVLSIVKYDGDTSDVLLKRSDSDELIKNTLSYVLKSLNNNSFKIIVDYEIY